MAKTNPSPAAADIVDAAKLGRVLGISRATIANLATDGVLPRVDRALELHHVVNRRLARGELGPRRLGQQDQINGPLDVLQLDCRHAGAAAERFDVCRN